jgi:hypothetical protein
MMTFVALVTAIALAQPVSTSIHTNRELDVIEARDGPGKYRKLFIQAGRGLGRWKIRVAGVTITGAKLIALAKRRPKEPFVRVVREVLRRPFDLEDFILFIDDVLRAGDEGIRGKLVWVPPGRARRAGILVHPDDVFLRDRPRLYGAPEDLLSIDRPKLQTRLPPAKDGDILGPNWTTRYPNPSGFRAKMKALDGKNPSGTYAKRVGSLIRQLGRQGCEVVLYSTVRNRRRGYLMWGAFMLSRMEDEGAFKEGVKELHRLNRSWNLNIPIKWSHPDGWKATIEAARQMADAYDVVYATRSGAKKSRHYDGEAVDFTAIALPRKLKLAAPDGEKITFDLSAAHQPRDLSLTPEIIEWVEQHFHMEKVRLDYPHWNDTAPPEAAKSKNGKVEGKVKKGG